MPKPKCTKDAVKNAVRLKKGGAADKDIARALDVRPETLSRWINDPKSELQRQLSQELKKAEADYKNALLAIIFREAKDKDWKAAAWLLERKYPNEYARQERVVADAEVKQVPVILNSIPCNR